MNLNPVSEKEWGFILSAFAEDRDFARGAPLRLMSIGRGLRRREG